MNITIWKLMPLLFASGLCSLGYQIVWMRELRLIFGASTLATSVVLAIFMGGIGLGSLFLGRKAEKHKNPLRLYGYLELFITVTALLTPFLLPLSQGIYLRTGGSENLGIVYATLIRIVFSAIILGLPTFFMGGTIPAVSKVIQKEIDLGRRDLGFILGMNTFGAVAGVLLVVFYMLEHFGAHKTLWSIGIINLFVAIIVLLLAQKNTPLLAGLTSQHTSNNNKTGPPSEELQQALPSRLFVLIAAFVSGFCFFYMEIVWYRLLAPLLGGTTYTIGIILAVILFGLAIGSWLYGLRRYTLTPTLYILALISSLEAIGLALPFVLGDRIAILASLIRPVGTLGLAGYVVGWFIISFIVVFPAALAAGYQFPLLIGLKGVGAKKIASETGEIYAWNTFGAITGSLLGGFILLPFLGSTQSWRLVIILLCVLAVASLFFSLRVVKKPFLMATPIGIVIVALLFLLFPGPSAVWRHSAIGAGRADLSSFSYNKIKYWINENRRDVFWEKDGRESSLAMNSADGLSFVVNGKIDGNVKNDVGTQIMGPLVSAILHPKPQQALVLGLGTGCSTGWLADIDSITRVDTIELEPAMLEVARQCAPMNRNALANKKVNIIVGDGREVIVNSREKYDLVFSDPSNPYRAGIASLYPKEFYQAIANRLNPGGYFSQWVQGYEVDTDTIKTIYTTLASVFPVVETWETKLNDLVFICSKEETDYSVSRLRKRIAMEPFRSGLLHSWGTTDLEGFLSHFIARSSLAKQVEQEGAVRGMINTDDRMLVEFGFARSLGKQNLLPNRDIAKQASERDENRPLLTDGTVDWRRVTINDHLKFVMEDWKIPADIISGHENNKMHIIALNYFLDKNSKGIMKAWQQYGRKPEYPMELAIVSEAMAEEGFLNSTFLEKLEQYWPLTGKAIRARYFWRTGRPREAYEILEQVLVSLRNTPWFNTAIIKNMLDLLEEIAGKDKEIAKKFLGLLSEPFSVYILNFERISSLVTIAQSIDPEYLARAIETIEPHPLWDETFLEERLKSYTQTGNPLAKKAEKDFQLFQKHAPQRFVVNPAPNKTN
jgi:spermidine synthase